VLRAFAAAAIKQAAPAPDQGHLCTSARTFSKSFKPNAEHKTVFGMRTEGLETYSVFREPPCPVQVGRVLAERQSPADFVPEEGAAVRRAAAGRSTSVQVTCPPPPPFLFPTARPTV